MDWGTVVFIPIALYVVAFNIASVESELSKIKHALFEIADELRKGNEENNSTCISPPEGE